MEIFLTNLGKYNEGELVGKWISLPISSEELAEVLLEIGIDGAEYEEYFITDYEAPFKVEEYDNLERLNEIAEDLETFTETQLKLLSVIEGEFSDIETAIDKVKDGEILYYEDISNEEDLGQVIADYWEIPEHLASYIDYEAIGRSATYEGWTIADGIAYYLG